MRLLLAALILLAPVPVALASNPPPMTVKDVSLMLRSGYDSDAVEREVSARYFIGALDATAEKNLVQAGATPALISSLKSGLFSLPASKVAEVQAELAAKEQRRAAQMEESRKFNSLYQAELAQKRSAPSSTAASQTNSIAALVKGQLVTSQNGITRPYLDAEFEKKKLIGIYFSAYWCGPCRKFTPSLVNFYNKNAAAHPEFEILFVSNDKSASAMETYMRDMHMPWPAVNFDKVAEIEALRKYAGSGIPCLVVVDETGKVIFDTFAGRNYRGPDAVVSELQQLFTGKSSGQLAQSR
jgi:nucleoredoxin